MTMMTWSRFRSGRSQAPRLLVRAVAMIKAEYKRAILAARYYDRLKNCSRSGPDRQRIGAGGIPRAVFEAVYSE